MRAFSANSGSRMPRAAPPAPSTSTSRPASATSRLTVRSRTMPAPSVLSAYQPSPSRFSVLARAGRLRALARRMRERERLELERDGDVEALAAFPRELPRPSRETVERRQQPLVAHLLRGRARERLVDLRRSRMRDGIADDGVAVHAAILRRLHRRRYRLRYCDSSWSAFVNVQVRVMCRMSVSRLMSGGNAANGPDISTMRTAAASRMRLPDVRLISTFSTLPSALDRHREEQAAVELLLARGLRVVEVADALDLEPPILDVAREAVLLRARADEAALRTLLVRLHVLRDLRLEAHRLQRLLHELVGRRQVGLLLDVGAASAATAAPARCDSCVMSSRVCFSSASTFCVATATCWSGAFFGSTGNGVLARRFASVLPPPSRLRLGEDVRLGGLGRRLGVDERHFERRSLVGQRLQVERPEVDGEHDEVDEAPKCRSRPQAGGRGAARAAPRAGSSRAAARRRARCARSGAAADGGRPTGTPGDDQRLGRARRGPSCAGPSRDGGPARAGRARPARSRVRQWSTACGGVARCGTDEVGRLRL